MTGAAAAALNQAWPAPAAPRPIVIVGAGGIVRDAHMPAYGRAGLTVSGVTDVDAERARSLAADFDLPDVYPDLAAAVRACGTDVVYDIATPPHTLPEILPELPDGAAVLMQKPMGADQTQARRIRQVCRDKRLTAAVNFQLRFSPMMLAVQDALRRGMLGDLLEIEVHINIFTPWTLFPFLIPMPRVEIAVHSIHYLDTIRAVAGNPLGVFARSLHDPRAADFAQTRTSVILDYGERLRALMSINHNHTGGRQFQSAWFRFEGTGGTMMVKLGVCYAYPNGEPDELWYCPEGGAWQQIPLEGSWFVDAFMGPMRNVQRAAAGADETLHSGVEDAYQTMALVEACFRSMERPGEPLTLD